MRQITGRFKWRFVMRAIGLASALVLVSAVPLAPAAVAQASGDLVGRWGVAAYWNAGDAQPMTQRARAACSQPYVISRGPKGGAVMFEPFDGKRREVQISGRQIVAADGADSRTTKTIQSWDGQVMVFTYDDEEAKRKYGNMVFVRCGR
jgi:hypothetical protein